MPYISQERRERLMTILKAVIHEDVEIIAKQDDELTVGDLNYLITRLVCSYIDVLSYQKFNDCIGILECAKLELYRRMVAPYEDEKCRQNGDVYDNAG